jgi:hypothetical protein
LRKTMLAAVAVLAAPAMAQDDVARGGLLAGGPVFLGPTQQLASCYVFNAFGPPSIVGLSSLQIIGQDGQPIALTLNTCGTMLLGSEMCVIQGAILNNSAYACAVETPRSGTGGVPSLRGLLQIGTEENPSMVTIPLQLTQFPP